MNFDNLTKFDNAAQAHEYIKGMWKTPEFRESAFVDKTAAAVSQRAPIFFNMTFPTVEWSQFSTWWGCFANRDYDNPYVHDLYLLHEFTHLIDMKFDGGEGDSFHAWFTRATRNEFGASIQSEVMAYFRIPGLREKTFKHPIWVDRQLWQLDRADPANMDRWASSIRLAMMDARQKVMRDPDPFDFCELQIAAYAKSNLAWAQIWGKRWRDVELHMSERKNLWFQTQEDHVMWLRQQCTGKPASTTLLAAPSFWAGLTGIRIGTAQALIASFLPLAT